MKYMNLIKKYSKIRSAAGMIVVGLIISIVAGAIFLAPDKGSYEKVDVTITDIESEGSGEDTTYSVLVRYEVGGQEYTAQLGSYQSNWKVGSVIECEYDVDNPANLREGDGKMMSLIICLVGLAAVAFGVFSFIKGVKASSESFAQYDRVHEVDVQKAREIQNRNESKEEFVFHFTGKLNQDYVMKNSFGEPVYEAKCSGIKLVKDTEYEFKNCLTGQTTTKKISHTITDSYGNSTFGTAFKSAFTIDGEICWDILQEMGYGFDFGLSGIKVHYEVRHEGVNIGFAELGGTGLMNEKYKDNPLGKVPTNGIFKIECPKSEVEGMFLICFCLSRTEETFS